MSLAEQISNPLEDAPTIDRLSARAQWAARAIRENIAEIQNGIRSLGDDASINKIAPITGSLYDASGPKKSKKFKVGIIGAGIAGLFTGMIFDHLKEKYNLDVDYEILEANQENRLGGRLYTHKFTTVDDSQENERKHDYYDVGAMRFPDIDIMSRTFALFRELGMKKNTKEDLLKAPIGELVPYYLSGPNQCQLYNGKQYIQKEGAGEATANTFEIPGIGTFSNVPPETIIRNAIKQFLDAYDQKDPQEFWKFMMEKCDKYTVRSWLTSKQKDVPETDLPYNTIEFCETLNYGNRWYDQALTEMVLETLDFDVTAQWYCIMGGAQELAYRTARKLRQGDIRFGSTVTAISRKDTDGDLETIDPITDNTEIEVTLKDGSVNTYDAVFNSTTLGAMQHMELEGLGLHWHVKQAIRSLGYGASCKVGIRFKEMWWMQEPYNIKLGGSSKTDQTIRCCVYPSYNVSDKPEKGGVLLVSYTWSQEAERIGSLISRDSPNNEEDLKKLLFHDLARLHTSSNKEYKKLHAKLETLYDTHYAYNWYADPTTVGAFAYFGPSQFQNMYQYITRSDGKYIIIGEGASAHHAWVVGALESAVRGVYQFLYKHSALDEAADRALKAYNNNQVDEPFGPVPAEYDRTQEIDFLWKKGEAKTADDTAVEYSVTGDFARQQVLFETLRIKQQGDLLKPGEISDKDIQPIMDALKALKGVAVAA